MRAATGALLLTLCSPPTAVGQAPPWTDLWRVAEGTLAEPAALANGPTGAFWNPAAVVRAAGPRFGVEAFQTPEVVNVSGLLLGASLGFGERTGIGVLAGRISVGDLIRTSSSPVTDEGEIPVYAQFLGASVGARLGPLDAGVGLLVHDAQLDGIDDGGLTLDAGLQVRPLRGFVLGAATHLGNAVISTGAATEYLLGAEYGFAIPPILGLESRLHARYGLTLREVGEAEHVGTAGLLLARRLLIDAGVLWAGGYGSGAWQPVLGLAFQAGPYRVGIARGSTASGLGGTYRLSLAIGNPS